MRNEKGQFVRKYKINEDKVRNDNSPAFYYFVGIMASDGNVRQCNKIFSLTQAKKSLNLIKFINNYLGSEYPIRYIEKTNSYILTVTSKIIVDRLSTYNIIPNKTLIYELPEFKNEKDFKYFIQGYLDGDGGVGIYDNGSGVKSLIVNIVGTKQFINECGKKLNTKGNIRQIKKCKNLYEIRFNGKKALDFCNEIYSNNVVFIDSYKYQNYKKFSNDDTMGLKYKKYYSIKPKVISELKNGESVNILSKKYGIPYKTVHTWKTRFIT